MPTPLPTPSSRPAHERRLPWSQVARLVILVVRVRLLDLRAHWLIDRSAGPADDRLLRVMRRWLALHEQIGVLLPGMPEPEHVREVRAILRTDLFPQNADLRPEDARRMVQGDLAE